MTRTLGIGSVLAASLLALAIAACQGSAPRAKQFSAADVRAIQNLLQELHPDSFRIVLPEYSNGQVVGSQTYGRLPVTQVRQVAAMRNLPYRESGNLQAIFQSCSGGGAGSHTESQSPGSDVGRRIERILARIDQSAYIYIR